MRRVDRAINAYQEDKILNSNKKELLEMVYDIGYRACSENNGEKARKVLYELCTGLDYRDNEISNRLFLLYQYMINLTYKDQFEEAGQFFMELRDAWREVIHSEEKDA